MSYILQMSQHTHRVAATAKDVFFKAAAILLACYWLPGSWSSWKQFVIIPDPQVYKVEEEKHLLLLYTLMVSVIYKETFCANSS